MWYPYRPLKYTQEQWRNGILTFLITDTYLKAPSTPSHSLNCWRLAFGFASCLPAVAEVDKEGKEFSV